jgi:hypothetical protein
MESMSIMAASMGRLEFKYGKPALPVGEFAADLEPGGGGKGPDTPVVEFMGIFRMDGLSRTQSEQVIPLAGNRHVTDRPQVHLDPGTLLIVKCNMLEIIGSEIGAGPPVDHPQNVPVEFERHSLTVIVGLFEYLPVLDHVDPQQQTVARSHACGNIFKETDGLFPVQVADGATEKTEHPFSGR